MKRSAEDESGHSHKKNKREDEHHKHMDRSKHQSSSEHRDRKGKHADRSDSRSDKHSQHHRQNENDHKKNQTPLSHEEALAQLPPATSRSAYVPSHVHFTVSKDLPTLPPIKGEKLVAAPFKHKSTTSHYDRTTSTTDISYERLEFIGDAYIELIASRLIFERFIHLPAGQQSQLRELLVKNETLAEYSRAYAFEDKIQALAKDRMLEDANRKGNKGFNKVLGDVFEAYVAAVILSDVEDGFAVVEKWLTALWAPKLVEVMKHDRTYASKPDPLIMHDDSEADVRTIYNPTAKADLQKRILGGKETKLEYEQYKDTVELKGDQMGQNKHFIALYLTGYGYERKLLGQGEGKNKVEAGNWAATEAMQGKAKSIVDECEKQLRAQREEREAKRAAEKNG